MFIQAFIFESYVKTLNKFVLGRLARLNKPQFYAMLSRIHVTCTPEIPKAAVIVDRQALLREIIHAN